MIYMLLIKFWVDVKCFGIFNCFSDFGRNVLVVEW